MFHGLIRMVLMIGSTCFIRKEQLEPSSPVAPIDSRGGRKVYSKEFLLSKKATGTQGDLLLWLQPKQQLPKEGKRAKAKGLEAFRDPVAQHNFAAFKLWLKGLLEGNSAVDKHTLCGLYHAHFAHVLEPRRMGLINFSLLQMLMVVLPGINVWSRVKDYPFCYFVCWDDGGGDIALTTQPLDPR
ncbi:expressed unknown protein [Seminavis robusta]|uniref:Uncharacterized protein n=1 Tax=Seminavis robusta TaxID=568900 RepID=A0A9N8HDR0_9STRA|nr:expressed unknown protein [Seminavis robusta]|eukprot:Sro269_g103931.1  (184) ;mRNA; f:20097-20648